MRLKDLENIQEPPPVPMPSEEKKTEPPKPELKPEEKKPELPKPEKKPSRNLLPWLAAAVCVVVLVLGICFGMGKPWKANVLRSDEIPKNEDGTYAVSPSAYSVFGSYYKREQILSVTFLSTQSHVPVGAWDISEAGDGSVLAWVRPYESLYRLFIAGDGGVTVGSSCRDLFNGYTSVKSIGFLGNFHTDAAEDMERMFYNCNSLKSLDLSTFDTANVKNMYGMFYGCDSLTSLDLSSFDTANVKDMRCMFQSCDSLISLNLSSFDTASVKDMYCMFGGCKYLYSLKLSDRFVTTNAYTSDMFYNCPAVDDWGHLLN